MKPSIIIVACALMVGGVEMYLADGDRRTFGNGALQEHMAIYDADDDGRISVEEFQALQADQGGRRDRLRQRWDADNDGTISPKEREAAKAQMRRLVLARRSERFDDEDLDADGKLTMDEFFAITAVADVNEADPSLAREIFDRLDKDDDTAISKEEFLRSLERIRTPASDLEPEPEPKVHPDRNTLDGRRLP